MRQAEEHATVWLRNRDVAVVQGLRHVVVLDLSRHPIDRPWVLNGTAAEVWRSLHDEPRRAEDIVDELSQLYGEPAELIRPDVEHFLGVLAQFGLARSAPSIPGSSPQ